MPHLEKAVCERRLAVVNMGNNGKIPGIEHEVSPNTISYLQVIEQDM